MSLTPIIADVIEAEKEELQWLLRSGLLGRSQNLVRMLTFLCAEHFAGRAEQIKEYSIAVEALGRRPDFDSQTDTIVRVTAHLLRKRLLDVYDHEGAHRAVHIAIPPGRYAPSFVHHAHEVHPPTQRVAHPFPPDVPARTDSTEAASQIDTVPESSTPATAGKQAAWGVALVVLLVVLCGTIYYFLNHSQTQKVTPVDNVLPATPDGTIHALIGAKRKLYVDHSGVRWTPGSFCSGGSEVQVAEQKIAGTEDPALYLGGGRGILHCEFPVKPGVYEIHLLFAETTDLPVATRVANLSVNAGASATFDVVDSAGGTGIATTRVMTGVMPENDGAIHLDFVSEISLLNAVEILPAPSDKLLPIRIVAASHPVTDSAGQVWLSDRYFRGGRRGQLADASEVSDLGIYGANRIGRFRYVIPVQPKERYRVRLFFREPWFGKRNGGSGGVGSRVFDVSCNGIMLLSDFDISKESSLGPVVKTFENVRSSAQGELELYFVPVENYPIVSAIEIASEP